MTHANRQTLVETPEADRQTCTDAPVIDHDVLASLAAAIGWQKVGHFITDFADHAAMHREQMRAALADADFDALYRSAHMLVSVSGSLGATRMSRLCDQLQRAAQACETALAQALFDDLEGVIDAALDDMKGLVTTNRS